MNELTGVSIVATVQRKSTSPIPAGSPSANQYSGQGTKSHKGTYRNEWAFQELRSTGFQGL